MPVIARLVHADEDTVREVIHRFNELGMRALDPRWAGGRPRRINAEDEEFLLETARTRPRKLGAPFTHGSVRTLVGYLADNPTRVVRIGRERARQLLARAEITFQRTKTWKGSTIRTRTRSWPASRKSWPRPRSGCSPLMSSGPVTVAPVPGMCWAPRGRPERLPANYSKTHGVRQFHGCYSISEDRLWEVVRARKSAGNTLAALRSIRATRPDGAPIFVILDNLSAHKGPAIRAWAARANVELCFTPTYSSWANPIEAHFGPLRFFVLANSDHPNHVVLTRELHAHLRWRNANARHPDLLAAQRRERARVRVRVRVRVRSERQRRWGHPATRAA